MCFKYTGNLTVPMRLFTAIDIPDQVKDALHSFIRRLKPFAKLSWCPVENLHITTKFIGEWPEARLPEMQRVLASVCEPAVAEPIPITIRGIGWFPDTRRPRVFWAGIQAGEPLNMLAHRTEQAVAALGVPIETRAFAPHLTLARIRTAVSLHPLRDALQALPSGCGFDFGSFEATDFFVYLSAGGTYTKLAAYRFAAGPVSQ